jgi:hypothetical protein
MRQPGIDDRLRETYDRAALWVARRPMNLFLKLDSFDCLVRVERHCDCLFSLFMHHGLRERGLRVKRHAPLNPACQPQHDQIFTFDGNASLVSLREESEEHDVRVREAL